MNLLELAAVLGLAAERVEEHLTKSIEGACVILEDSAKEAIGTYTFGWPPLGPEAIARHGDTPLLETGALQSSITHTAEGREGWVGTNDEKAAWQEFGTSRGIPPRPFLGGAVIHEQAKIESVVAAEVIKAFP